MVKILSNSNVNEALEAVHTQMGGLQGYLRGGKNRRHVPVIMESPKVVKLSEAPFLGGGQLVTLSTAVSKKGNGQTGG